MINNRIERLQQIASELNVNASIKSLGNNIYANINGQSFKVNSYEQFKNKCLELEDYEAPAPVDLTERLTRIEDNYLNNL